MCTDFGQHCRFVRRVRGKEGVRGGEGWWALKDRVVRVCVFSVGKVSATCLPVKEDD